jgi:LPS sulfotransferase NodH
MLLGAEEGVQMLSDASKMGIRIVRIQREDTVRQGVSLAIHRKWSRGKPDFVDFCKNLDLSVQEVRAVIEEVRENNRFYDEWLEKEGIEVLTLYHEELYECPEETRTASLKRFLSYIGVSWTEEVREGAIRLCGPERKHTPEWVFQKFSPRQP